MTIYSTHNFLNMDFEDLKIQAVEEILNFGFSNKSLIREALRAPGRTWGFGNKNLAQVGHAVLRLCLVLEGRTRGLAQSKQEHRVHLHRAHLVCGQRKIRGGSD